MTRPTGSQQLSLEDETGPIRDRRLRPRERLFVEAYCGVANFNAAQAYEIAGYKPARENAGRLLRRPHIQRAIEIGIEDRRRRLQMDAEEAKERLTLFARGNIRKFLSPHDPLQALPDDDLALIKSITPGRYGRKIELHDPVRCTELMAKISGALKDVVKVEHTLEDIVAGAFVVKGSAE